MDSLYLIIIACVTGGALLLLVIFKRDLALKYWGYIAAALAAIAGIVWAIAQRKQPDPVADAESVKKTEELHTSIAEVIATHDVRVEEARTEEHAAVQELEAIHAITDKEERLRRLSALLNRSLASRPK